MIAEYFIRFMFSFFAYGLTSVLAAAIICLVQMKKKGQKKFLTHRNIVILVFSFYLAVLLSVTVLPEIEFFSSRDQFIYVWPVIPRPLILRPVNIIPFREILNDLSGNADDALLNLAGNIALFIPYGIILPAVMDNSDFRINRIPLLTSVTIEIVQIIEARRCDIDDVILNTTGAVLGWAIFRLWNKKRRKSLSLPSVNP